MARSLRRAYGADFLLYRGLLKFINPNPDFKVLELGVLVEANFTLAEGGWATSYRHGSSPITQERPLAMA